MCALCTGLSGSGDTTPTEPPTEPNPPNTGLIVGVVIGVLVIAGAVVFIMIVIYVVKRQKNKDKHDRKFIYLWIILFLTTSSHCIGVPPCGCTHWLLWYIHC